MNEKITKERVASALNNLFEDAPSESDVLWNYRKAAAVLEYFSFNEIFPVDAERNKDDALACLHDVSNIVYDENRQPQRSLNETVRREALQRIYNEDGMEGFRRALAANAERPQTGLQKLFEAYLNGETPDIKGQSKIQMLCTAQISSWLHGILENVPEPAAVSQIIAIESLLAPFEFLLNVSAENPDGTFFGRENEINKLYDYVEVHEASSSAQSIIREGREIFNFQQKPPLMIYAPGGTGKSTLLAKFVLDHARYKNTHADDSRFPFVYLDFDNPSLSPAEPLSLLLEAIEQLSVQYPEHSALLLKMRDEWLSRIRPQKRSPVKRSAEKLDFQIENRAPFIEEFAQVINNKVNTDNAPLLFLIDTFEEVQWRSQAFVEGILKFLEDLQSHVPRLRTIISGRSEVKSRTYKIENYVLPPFDPLAAQSFLQKNGVEDLSTAQEIVSRIGGSPLTLRLAAELYKLEGIRQEGIPDLKVKETFFSRLKEETIQAQLYKRILGHIHNDDVKDLAHPGLVLRRITAELIYKVLAEPCEIAVPDMAAAEKLFEELKKEIALVSVEDKAVLRHRPDVRSLMLKLLKDTQAEKVRQIHENAVKFYENSDDDISSRTEEIYHRLSLGLDRAKLDERWRANLQFRRDDIEELPPKSQAYLAAHLQIEVDQSIWNEADFEDWERYVVRAARELIKADKPDDALELIRRRKDGEKSSEILVIEREIKIKRARLEELKGKSFTEANKLPMSDWYSPVMLVQTLINTISYFLVGEKSSSGTVSSLKAPFFDYSKELIRTIDDFKTINEIETKEIWIDYVSDVGDGWNSTYSVAYNLAKPRLEVAGQTLNRGELLIFGGDIVYPRASMQAYKDRVMVPYQMAFKAGGTGTSAPVSDIVNLNKEPHVFALPGDTDWYDNLFAFKKIFCSYYYNNRSFADGWQTRQKQNYFALKLPHNWWLFGFDLQLGRNLDENQLQYFESVCENMQAGDKVILCVQQPYWTTAIKYQNLTDSSGFNEWSLERIEDFLGRRGISINVYLAGGLHHYRRFENEEEGIQKITAGGGGAFLHPTHDFDFRKMENSRHNENYVLKADYPSPEESRKQDWKLLYDFFPKNKTFGIITGVAYAILAWLIQGQVWQEFSWSKTFIFTLSGLAAQPFAALSLIAMLLGFIFFTDSNSKAFKYIAGFIHGLTNLTAIFFASWFGFLISDWIVKQNGIENPAFIILIKFQCIITIAFFTGYFLGSIIMSIYLFVSIHFFGRHDNEAFSALRIEDYKNFLRLHINDSGDLTIYPLKIDKVQRDWKPIYGYYEPADSNSANEPQLIETPIVVK